MCIIDRGSESDVFVFTGICVHAFSVFSLLWWQCYELTRRTINKWTSQPLSRHMTSNTNVRKKVGGHLILLSDGWYSFHSLIILILLGLKKKRSATCENLYPEFHMFSPSKSWLFTPNFEKHLFFSESELRVKVKVMYFSVRQYKQLIHPHFLSDHVEQVILLSLIKVFIKINSCTRQHIAIVAK